MSSAMYWPTSSSSVARSALSALLGELAGGAGGELLAGLDHDLAGLGVDQVLGRLDALQRSASNGTRQPSPVARRR